MTTAPGFTRDELHGERSTALARTEARSLVNLNDAQLELLRGSFGTKLLNAELQYFAAVCRRTGLDPFRKQIYAIHRGGKMTVQTGIDGFRAVAARSGEYEGQTPAEWCGEDGVWRDVWLKKEPPAAARVGVYRRGFRAPVFAVARFASYAQENLWKKMPEVMIAKCAEALALRKAFPEDMSGLYAPEEMAQAGTADLPAHDPETGVIHEEPAAPNDSQHAAEADYLLTIEGVTVPAPLNELRLHIARDVEAGTLTASQAEALSRAMQAKYNALRVAHERGKRGGTAPVAAEREPGSDDR